MPGHRDRHFSLMLLFLFTKVDRGLCDHDCWRTSPSIRPTSSCPCMPEAQADEPSTPTRLRWTWAQRRCYALTHVIIPECTPGIITGAMLAFTLSLDDFTISYFTTTPHGAEPLHADLLQAARRRHRPDAQRAERRSCSSRCWCCCIIVNRRTASNNSQKARRISPERRKHL